jgi:hypothetical protein
MITPIAFRCESCPRITEILDTKVHGYHAEVGKLEGGVGSAKIRGTGDPSFHRCRQCSGVVFDFVVGFVHWDFDIIFDAPTLPAHNFFNEFLMLCTCTLCGGVSEPVMLGKL